MKQILFTLLLIFSLQQGKSQKIIGDPVEANLILQKALVFSEYVVASDYDKIGEAYTQDAKIFPNTLPIIEGRDSIVDYWRLPDDRRIIHHKATSEEIKITGTEAYDYGYYEGITRDANGNETSWKGKYVIVWRKVGKEWKMYLDIWNSIL